MHLAQSLEELIASRNVQDAVKFTAAMTQEQRLTISEDFQEQYGSSVGDHIRKLMSPSSSTSLLINMWLPTKILRLRVLERNFKELVPLELAHCAITCPQEEFVEICDIYNTTAKASLYAGIRRQCIGPEPWKYLVQQWVTFNHGSISNLVFLRDQARCAIESVDGRLFVDTIFSADRTVWPVVCKEYECQYGAPLIKDLAVFGEDSAPILSFACLFICDQTLAISYLLNQFIMTGDNDGAGIVSALYSEEWHGVPMAYVQYGSLKEDIRANFSSRYTEALATVWKI
ncbi:Alpha-18 giardin [Giardia duodenalis]|uniref:Alpha-18 giardin n=2 Tax=Giardia intestinalis TaxID=5741 RepID=E2RU06_GIAIC|nr:Alpha-18 giardin [Giardia intestinalis]AAX07972.1 alpha-18 giardin [Giardia lamblia ATCC 50803]KAE8304691.1 Alpha-18 giardin [Giardia intestinalis]|eukprot:XP_001705087.1 Alpha-18 giardin [Giardia lamblia ATCC 50803]